MMNRKVKNNIKKFILIPPEIYEQYKRGILIHNPASLSEIEIDMLNVMKNHKLTTGQRLMVYNDILTTKLYKSLLKNQIIVNKNKSSNEIRKHDTQINKHDKEIQIGSPIKLKKTFQTQTSPRKRHYFAPKVHSSMIEEADESDIEAGYDGNNHILKNQENDLDIARSPNHFYGQSVYENFPLITQSQREQLDQKDYQQEREKIYERMKKTANVNSLRELDFDDKLDKSFIKFKKHGSFTQYAIDKNDLTQELDQPRYSSPLPNTTKKRAILAKIAQDDRRRKKKSNKELLETISSPNNKKAWLNYK